MQRKIQTIGLCIVIALTVMSGGAVAQSDPGTPVTFVGNAVDADGTPAPTGTTIVAAVDGNEVGSITVSTQGVYAKNISTADKLRAGTQSGDEVTFHVGSPSGAQGNETYTVTSSTTEEIDLEFPSGTFQSGNGDNPPEDNGNGNGNGNGAAPGPGASDGQEDGADDAPPTVQQVRDTLNLIEPDADVSSEIADDNPDTPGLSVSPEGTQSVRNINFNNEDLTGTVSVREYNNPPEEVAQQVSESVADQVEGIAGDDGGADNIDVVSVSDITVETEDTLADTSATVTKAVDRGNVDNPDQLVVVKETFNEEAQTERWAQLETEVVETTDEEVVLEAQVESFSLFAVAEVEQTDGDGTADDGAEDDDGAADDGATDDGLPGFGAVAALLALVGTMLYARRHA